MTRGPNIDIQPATAERWADFEVVFGRNGAYAGCWCMWPRLRSRDWSASRAPGRKLAMKELIDADERPGLLAYVDGEPAGWVAVAPREQLQHFEHSSRLKKLSRPEGLWSIPCFVIRKDFRGAGLMGRLLEGAIAHASEQGSKVIEAYPIEPRGALKSYEGFSGIVSTFRRAGFEQVGGTEDRPVMRLELPAA